MAAYQTAWNEHASMITCAQNESQQAPLEVTWQQKAGILNKFREARSRARRITRFAAHPSMKRLGWPPMHLLRTPCMRQHASNAHRYEHPQDSLQRPPASTTSAPACSRR
eukprot:5775559-Pleurochrysis_carterae.AAC.1